MKKILLILSLLFTNITRPFLLIIDEQDLHLYKFSFHFKACFMTQSCGKCGWGYDRKFSDFFKKIDADTFEFLDIEDKEWKDHQIMQISCELRDASVYTNGKGYTFILFAGMVEKNPNSTGAKKQFLSRDTVYKLVKTEDKIQFKLVSVAEIEETKESDSKESKDREKSPSQPDQELEQEKPQDLI